jgi:CheY-like chemotaxis protein
VATDNRRYRRLTPNPDSGRRSSRRGPRGARASNARAKAVWWVRSPLPSAVLSNYLARLLSAENRERWLLEQPLNSIPDQKTVLVVDDEESILKNVSFFLRAGNFNVLTASSGEEALQKSRDFKEAIHLLLTDFQMPGMDGINLATAMSVDRPQLKVLMMSGFTSGMLVLNEGWHFLPKPFIASQLLALVVGLASPDQKSRFSM